MFAVHHHVPEAVHEGLVRRLLPGGGQVALTAVALYLELEVGPCLRASVGVFFRPSGMDEPQVAVQRAGEVEQVDQGVAQPGVVGGPLLAMAVVEVLDAALVEAFPYCRCPRVVVVLEGVFWPGARARASCATPSSDMYHGVAARRYAA